MQIRKLSHTLSRLYKQHNSAISKKGKRQIMLQRVNSVMIRWWFGTYDKYIIQSKVDDIAEPKT